MKNTKVVMVVVIIKKAFATDQSIQSQHLPLEEMKVRSVNPFCTLSFDFNFCFQVEENQLLKDMTMLVVVVVLLVVLLVVVVFGHLVNHLLLFLCVLLI